MISITKEVLAQFVFIVSFVVAITLAVAPLITSGNTAGDAFLKIEGVEGEAALSEDTNVCDGVTCADGSCAPTQAECGVEATISPDIYADHDREVERTRAESLEAERAELHRDAEETTAIDSVCNGFLCPDGACVSDEVWCGVDFDFSSSDPAAAVDSVCNGYLCNDGTCVSDAVWCDMDLTNVPGAAVSCSERTPVRCGDGSCGASPGVCRSLPDVEWPDQREVDDPSVSEDFSFPDTDDDGDGVPTRLEAAESDSYFEGDQQRTNAQQTRQDEADIDIVDPDDIITAQDYNSTRSNKRENEFFNPDDDAEDDESGVATVSAERLAAIVNDPPNVRCGAMVARADEEGKLYCWGGGVRAAATGEENEDGSLATSTRVLRHLSVRGDEVRAWSDQERAEFARFRELTQERNTPETLLADVTSLIIENDRVRELEVDETEARMTYRAQLRLFGFIPMEREVTARAAEVDAVAIDYPWYSFLARKPDTPAIENVFSSLSTTIAARGGGAGKVSLSDFDF